MKRLVAILMVVSLQFAVAQLCLCSGMSSRHDSNARADLVSTPSCCETSKTSGGQEKRQPCPHCDQTDTMDLGVPVKGATAPDATLVDFFDPTLLQNVVTLPALVSLEVDLSGCPPPLSVGPRAFRELIGVFLI